jgi:hypothetical protein
VNQLMDMERDLEVSLRDRNQQETQPRQGEGKIAPNEAGKGEVGPCANRNCSIGGGIANSTHRCPSCQNNTHAVCGEETENLHYVLCPHCKEKEDENDNNPNSADKDSDKEEEDGAVTKRGTQGSQQGRKRL